MRPSLMRLGLSAHSRSSIAAGGPPDTPSWEHLTSLTGLHRRELFSITGRGASLGQSRDIKRGQGLGKAQRTTVSMATTAQGEEENQGACVQVQLLSRQRQTTMATQQKLMRAIRVFEFGGPQVLKLRCDVPVPEPKENQVLIKVHACGVNPVETYIRSGTYSRIPTLPYTPGSDVAGVVESVGRRVGHLKKGDRVFTTKTVTGGYAEYTIASEHTVFPLPEKMDFGQGASIGIPYFTAFHALIHRAQAKAGETVLVHGASGGVGVAACQIARAYGLKVLGTAGTEEGKEIVLKNGAHKVFNHREADYVQKIKEYVGESGLNVIIEMLSNVNLQKDLQLLSFRGRVIVVGCRGPIEINPRDTMNKESSIIGASLYCCTKEDFLESSAALLAGMEMGWLWPVVGPQYPLENVEQAHEDIIKSQGALGKMILVIN